MIMWRGRWAELRGWWHGLRRAPWRAWGWHIRSMWRVLTQLQDGQASVRATGVLFLLGAMIVLVVLLMSNAQHALVREHSEAPAIRAAFVEREPNAVEFYYSLGRGTVLALFSTEDGQWAGLVHRVTENQGAVWLADEGYECTAFVAERAYWDRVLKRDRYVPLVAYPSIMELYFSWVRGQYR